MASIRREIQIDVPPEQARDALSDIGNLHTRLVPGFVTACRVEGDARVVTFGNGVVATERIVDIDPAARRLVWSASGGRLSHHNASAQVFEHAGGTRFVWIADLLPNDMAPAVAAMIDMGIATIKKTLEANRS